MAVKETVFFLIIILFPLALGATSPVKPKAYDTLGCYKDTADRAIPTLEGTDAILDGNYQARIQAIEKCYEAANKRGFKVFAVQDGGWCASSATADKTFDKYGASSACGFDGEGGPWANQVYSIRVIDGGYSKWSYWSQCSTTCGDGLRSHSRSCTNPPPKAEGKDCAELGPNKETEECNNGRCPGCNKTLGMESGAISDKQISASSHQGRHAAERGRLHFHVISVKVGSWSVRVLDVNQWLQVDMGTRSGTKLTGVATQGGTNYCHLPRRVTKYKLQYSDDGVNFQRYKEQGGSASDKEFVGNKDRDTVVYHDLNPPITARYIRFRPTAWKKGISMRVELYGCQVIDGDYSKWSSWSKCSTTCGVGLRSRSRSCTNPPPNAEGTDCTELGPNKETEECNNGNCPGCPAGWVTHGVSCYYLDPTRTRWVVDAKQKCQNLGAHLPIIKSANEKDFIFDMLRKHQSLTIEGVWLGLERRAGSTFYWVDGTPLSYQPWGGGEPNNSGGNENCVQMYKGGGNAGMWNDTPCDYELSPGVLCQKPI